MNTPFEKIISTIIYLCIYSLLFYFLQTSQLRSDFACFYSAAIAYAQGTDPYINLVASYMAVPVKLPANLNPPFFLPLLVPLTNFNFHVASSLWFLSSLLLGAIGALLSFKLSFPEDFFKKYWLTLLFIYLGMFATLINTGIGQIGGICSFFIITGYYFYLRKYDYLAGTFWGFIIAVKLFPALLFLFVLNQKRYKVFLIMILCCLLAFLIPLWDKGMDIYSIYFNMLSRVAWFGDNWNASLYGFLFRLFVDLKSHQSTLFIKIIYLPLFGIILLWYIRKIHLFRKTANNNPADHKEFCFTLLIMLLLSPFGWLYYFSLLIMPLTIIWQALLQEKTTSTKIQALWALCLILINFPIGYVEAINMSSLLSKVSVYSMNFYGLIIIIYLFTRLNPSPPPIVLDAVTRNKEYTYPIIVALALGLFITLCVIIMQIITAS
ncbi:glycosyltransferase family 87 protein [Legionella fallonii]|uniref:Putative integral membrane protein n=1 Tax=Legionella fallonii LLAP-10 TaxID=1212491 RepID=A0A098G7X6_9GAMM|nr:glycosyltransferase family 87 protein [Legionella fallonii]CEG58064.1 putative integral membrane protein [Legionella fallonii LLAP-10]